MADSEKDYTWVWIILSSVGQLILALATAKLATDETK